MLRAYKPYARPARARFLRGFLLPLAGVLVLAFLFHSLINHFLVGTYRVDSDSMLPVLREGDRVLASPLSYGARVPLLRSRLPGLGEPERGEVVILVPPYASPQPALVSLFDPLFRFFTLRRLSLVDGPGRPPRCARAAPAWSSGSSACPATRSAWTASWPRSGPRGRAGSSPSSSSSSAVTS